MTFLSLQDRFLQDCAGLTEQFKATADKARELFRMFLADNAELDPAKPVLYLTYELTNDNDDAIKAFYLDNGTVYALIYNVLKEWEEGFEEYGDERNAIDISVLTIGEYETLVAVLGARNYSWESLEGAYLKAGH